MVNNRLHQWPLALTVLRIDPCQSSTGSSAAATSGFNVLIPKALSRPDGYSHRNAMFGNPPYGGTIQQQVYYTPSKLCNSSELSNIHNKESYWKSPYILMVDRGGCSFVQKVRNAQRVGAAAVLIADDICICGKPMCPKYPGGIIDETQEYGLCESGEPLMTDDGSGSDISIPSFLLYKHDVEPIRASLMEGETVRVQMSFSVPAPDKRVQYDLWTSPADSLTRELQLEFSSAVQALQDHAIFTPHMYIIDGKTAGCHDGENGRNLCPELCSNAGRYCSVEQLDLKNGATGADIVKESLRRICIWNLYGENDGVGMPWWTYVQKFTQMCDSESFADPDCIARTMETAGVDSSKVNQCTTEAGGTEGDAVNTLLEAELKDQTDARVFMMPSRTIDETKHTWNSRPEILSPNSFQVHHHHHHY